LPAKVGVLSQLHGWALVRANSPAEGTGFEPSVPLQGCAGKEAVAATGVVIIRRGQYRLKPWSIWATEAEIDEISAAE
jgi:hypothetical protein